MGGWIEDVHVRGIECELNQRSRLEYLLSRQPGGNRRIRELSMDDSLCSEHFNEKHFQFHDVGQRRVKIEVLWPNADLYGSAWLGDASAEINRCVSS